MGSLKISASARSRSKHEVPVKDHRKGSAHAKHRGPFNFAGKVQYGRQAHHHHKKQLLSCQHTACHHEGKAKLQV